MSEPEVKKPVVKSKGKKRLGRGFSISELMKAGISLQLAKRLNIPVDKRRRSCWDENVQALREILMKSEKS